MHNYLRRKRGVILEQYLIALMIMVSLLPVSLSCALVLEKSKVYDARLQDEIALAQLRHILFVSDNFTVSGSELYFTYHDEECELDLVNSRLVMKPGTQIFLTDIDELHFQLNNDLLEIYYVRESESYARTLAKI